MAGQYWMPIEGQVWTPIGSIPGASPVSQDSAHNMDTTQHDTASANTICIIRVTGQDTIGPIMWKPSPYTSLLCDNSHISSLIFLDIPGMFCHLNRLWKEIYCGSALNNDPLLGQIGAHGHLGSKSQHISNTRFQLIWRVNIECR